MFFTFRSQKRGVKLVVGLGNPGPAYAKTRHNAGFLVLREFSKECGFDWKKDRFLKAEVAEGTVRGKEVVLACPQTYMNLSGQAVAALMRRKKISFNDLLVVYDDVDLDLGQIRLKPKGSAAGHKGIESIIAILGTQDFARLKVGIGPCADREELSNFVLEPFVQDERFKLQDILQAAAEAVGLWLVEGAETVMNHVNRRGCGSREKE